MLRKLEQPLLILGVILLVIAVVLYVCYYRMDEEAKKTSSCMKAGMAMLVLGVVSIGVSLAAKTLPDAPVLAESRYSSPFAASRYSSS